MNYKEAKENTKVFDCGCAGTHHPVCNQIDDSLKFHRSKGFIEAVEKLKPVVDALKLYTGVSNDPLFVSSEIMIRLKSAEIKKIQEILESYRRDVLGEKE